MGDLEGLDWIIFFVVALLLIGFVGYQLGRGW
jgi:Sec-independent protein translocase protein TatA